MTQTITVDEVLAKDGQGKQAKVVSTSPSIEQTGSQRDDGRPEKGLAARDVLVILIFGCRVVQTYMRMGMGALVIYVCEDFDCGTSWRGLLLSAHAFGYCTTQILGGALADRIGGKRLITAAMALAGLSLASTAAAARLGGLWAIAATQFVMGVAMGPLFPAGVQLLSRWLPPSERARASTALDTGITLGSLIVVPSSSFLAVTLGWGWGSALFLFGASSVAFAVVWSQLAPETWENCRFCSEAERRFLEREVTRSKPKSDDAKGAGSSFRSFLEGLVWWRLWAIYLSHFTFNYGVYFVNSWSATYYLETFGLRPEHAGLHLGLPHIFNMVVKLLFNGWLEKWLRSRHYSTLACRRTFTSIGFVVPAVCFLLAPWLSFSIHLTTLIISLGLGAMALHPSGFKANYMDVTVSKGGLVSGLGNTIASVSSSVGPLIVAQLQARTGSWAPAFVSVTVLDLAAAALFATCSSSTPIEEEESKRRE